MRVTVKCLALAGMLSCAGEGRPATPPEGERARDSVIGASRLPGAGGVRGALRASDSAAARRTREDSATLEPLAR